MVARVPENVEKKAATQAKLNEEKQAALALKKTQIAKKRHGLMMRTLKYEKEYRSETRRLVAARRTAKKSGNFFVEPEAKVMFVVRLAGINKIPPKPRKIMQLLRLRQINNGVFVRVNFATMQMVRCIAPYVTFGYPSLSTIKKLVYKRGHAKVKGQRIPLQDNELISENLGKFGIHGMEDLIHEIHTCGPNFKEANNFLWTFKLSSPRGGWESKRHGFTEPRNGSWGNREALVNELIGRMN